MAWRWFVASTPLKATNSTQVQIDVKYYDDANPSNTPTPTVFLHAQSFFFEPSVNNAAMRTMVESEGQRARTAFDRAAVIAGNNPTGTTGVVP